MPGLSEFDLIDQLLKPLARGTSGAFALSDDAAVLPELQRGHVHVVTKDALASGVHVLESTLPDSFARKALRVNLSDLASMGATPVGFFMALCLNEQTSENFVKAFVEGLSSDVDAFSIPLMGGDIIRKAGPFTVTITAVGSVLGETVLRRSGAEVGDGLWVSGTIGDGALGLLAARGELDDLPEADKQELISRYEIPDPRLRLGEALRGVANACIDISDGLCADVAHVCRASKVGAEIDVATLPLSRAAQNVMHTRPSLLETVVAGGDDYELAFAVPADKEPELQAVAKKLGLLVTRIGEFKVGADVHIRDQSGKVMDIGRLGYRHF